MRASAAADISAVCARPNAGCEPDGRPCRRDQDQDASADEEAISVVRLFLAAARSEALDGKRDCSRLIPWSAWSRDCADGEPFKTRPPALMEGAVAILSELGYAAETEPIEDGWILRAAW